MTVVALMTCVWCARPRWCRPMDIGWVCDHCWETAEGIHVHREAA